VPDTSYLAAQCTQSTVDVALFAATVRQNGAQNVPWSDRIWYLALTMTPCLSVHLSRAFNLLEIGKPEKLQISGAITPTRVTGKTNFRSTVKVQGHSEQKNKKSFFAPTFVKSRSIYVKQSAK